MLRITTTKSVSITILLSIFFYTLTEAKASQQKLISALPAVDTVPSTIVSERWERLFFDDFESNWPGQRSSVDQDEYSGEDTWASVTCGPTPISGNYSCWCSGDGDMTPCSQYDTYQDAWLTYGPFSLEDCVGAKVIFYLSIDSEEYFDKVTWAVSTNGLNFAGYSQSGQHTDWTKIEYDLTQSGDYGNVCGMDQVWIAFNFNSDWDTCFSGAYLDDIEILIDKGDPAPDIEPYQPDGWDDIIVVSTEPDTTNSDDIIYEEQDIYIDYSCINTGTHDANAFSFGLWIDGQKISETTSNGLYIDENDTVLDVPIGKLSAGHHDIVLKCDFNDEVTENDETNNEYLRQIYIRETEPDAEIHGHVWNDLDANGIWDPNELALSDWQVYLDLDENCQLNDDDPVCLTDPNGAYQFTELQEGSYVVSIAKDDYCTQTFPPSTAGAYAGPSTYLNKLSRARREKINAAIQDSPPHPPVRMASISASDYKSSSSVILYNVPTSTWTYGCSATSAGMLFGYYDRTGYPNMYTGPTNGGLCPLSDLGQGIDSPIEGACSIIATQNGFDGRQTNGHVDDYWIDYEHEGPDPWKSGGIEHEWGDCTADYMGTNQWKWDFNLDGTMDSNVDGATTYYYNTDGSILYDPIMGEQYGSPQTTLCHGIRLFAESRGYSVVSNYNQQTDNINSNGFSFNDYKAEINAFRPVLIHVQGHTMIGVGYDPETETIYLHDTWDNNVHSMIWGGSYASRELQAVTVFVLDESSYCSGSHIVELSQSQIITSINFGNNCPRCGRWGYWSSDINHDCYVNLEDLAIIASQWTNCSHPDYEECSQTSLFY